MRLHPPKVHNLKCLCAFSLVEVTLALGIASFALIGIFGLLPVGITSNQTSLEQTAAASLARAIVADLRCTPLTSGTSATFHILIPSATTQQLRFREDGSLDPTGTTARYLAYITFPNTPTGKTATPIRILLTWPAAADLNNTPPKNYAGSYEVLTALDRN
jgi:uncharacterized protein (TIGR02598 family)